MSFFKDKPVRNKQYLAFVRGLPCSMCKLPDHSVAHHIIGVGEGGMGTKACDLLTMPLCAACHHEIHHHPRYWPNQWEYVARTLQKAVKEGLIKEQKNCCN